MKTNILKTVKQKVKRLINKQKSQNLLVSLVKSEQKIRLDLGCGAFKREGFIGLDLHPEADIQWNITQGLPFADNTVLEIRSDHFFEHLELPKVVRIFQECYRVLIPDGILDFTVPHFDPYLDAYLKKDYDFLQDKIDDIPQDQQDLYNTCFDRIVWLLHRAGEHKSLFDEDSLVAKLKLAGFKDIKTREFNSKYDINFRFSSIYMVAVK